MQLLLMADQSTGAGGVVQQIAESVFPVSGLVVVRGVDELTARLRKIGSAGSPALIFVADQIQLEQIIPLKNFIHKLRLVLILPDHDKKTIALGHRLRPRFLAFADGDLDEVTQVLKNLRNRSG